MPGEMRGTEVCTKQQHGFDVVGRRQVGKAPDFGSGIRWFESSRPSHLFVLVEPFGGL